MAFPNKVVKENFKTTGKSAILSDRREIQILETTSKYLFSEKKNSTTKTLHCIKSNVSDLNSPTVEQGFLPWSQFVSTSCHCVSKLYELATEGDFTQEQNKGIQPTHHRRRRRRENTMSESHRANDF